MANSTFDDSVEALESLELELLYDDMEDDNMSVEKIFDDYEDVDDDYDPELDDSLDDEEGDEDNNDFNNNDNLDYDYDDGYEGDDDYIDEEDDDLEYQTASLPTFTYNKDSPNFINVGDKCPLSRKADCNECEHFSGVINLQDQFLEHNETYKVNCGANNRSKLILGLE